MSSSQTHRHLRRRRHRRRHRLLPQPAWCDTHRDRASPGRRFGLRQVGRLPGARLVPRQPARSTGAAKLHPACRACRDAGQSLGLSPSRYLWRLRRRGWRTQSGRAAVAVRRRDDHGPTRLAADDGDRRAARLHHGPDGRGREARRRAAARHGRRPGARQERRARRRARRRRDRRRRRRGDRHGAVVDPGDALAAAARCLRLQGPQPDLPDR